MRLRTLGASVAMVLTLGIFAALPGSSQAQARAMTASLGQSMAPQDTTLVSDLVAQGGRVTAGNQWVVMPSGVQVSLVPMTFSDCGSGFVCLFENANWTGRLLKSNQAGARIDLSANSFNDIMSSWVNESPYDAKWFYNAGFTGTARCMQANTSNSNVGSTDNDKASSLAIYTDALAC